MAATPIEALIAHLKAFETLDDAAFAESLAFPFTHLYPDGDMNRWSAPAEVSVGRDLAKFGLERATYGRITMDSCHTVMDLPRVKVFHVTATRYAAGSDVVTSRAQAVWVVLEEGGDWKVKLRVGPGPLPLPGG
jgi:hypothetical protein